MEFNLSFVISVEESIYLSDCIRDLNKENKTFIQRSSSEIYNWTKDNWLVKVTCEWSIIWFAWLYKSWPYVEIWSYFVDSRYWWQWIWSIIMRYILYIAWDNKIITISSNPSYFVLAKKYWLTENYSTCFIEELESIWKVINWTNKKVFINF